MEWTSNEVKTTSVSKVLVALCITLFVGVIYGSVLIGSKDNVLIESLQTIVNGFTVNRQNQSIVLTFFNSFTSAAVFLMLPYIFGYWAISQPLSFIVVFVKGLSIGTVMGYFYSYYGLKGFGYSAIIIMPVAVITSFVLIIANREAIKMSNILFALLLNKKEASIGCNVIKLYNLKFLILMGFMLVSAVVDTLLVLIFSRFFAFA